MVLTLWTGFLTFSSCWMTEIMCSLPTMFWTSTWLRRPISCLHWFPKCGACFQLILCICPWISTWQSDVPWLFASRLEHSLIKLDHDSIVHGAKLIQTITVLVPTSWYCGKTLNTRLYVEHLFLLVLQLDVQPLQSCRAKSWRYFFAPRNCARIPALVWIHGWQQAGSLHYCWKAVQADLHTEKHRST